MKERRSNRSDPSGGPTAGGPQTGEGQSELREPTRLAVPLEVQQAVGGLRPQAMPFWCQPIHSWLMRVRGVNSGSLCTSTAPSC